MGDTHICGNKPDAPPTCTVVPPDGSPDCKRTFYICNKLLTADAAQAYCQQYGMRLATVETQAIFNYISPHVVAFRKSLGPWSENHGFSLAASDVNSPGQWYWIPSTTPFNFKPWATGEPSGGGEHCLELRQTGDNTLLSFNDYPCNAYRFICEHKSA